MLCPLCNSPNQDGATACRACGAPVSAGAPAAVPALSVGTKLQGGAFTVGKVLGQGGFGITYLGSETRFRRSVAIKELYPHGRARQGAAVLPAGALTAADYPA